MKFLKTLLVALILATIVIFILFSKEIKTSLIETFAATKQTSAKVNRKPLDVPLLKQMDRPKLYNGCEVTSLAMILNYSGYDVTKNELAQKVKRVPLQYKNGLKGNPNDGFVGDMEKGPGLSVYHGPIYELATSYAGDKVLDLTGSKLEKIYEQLNQSRPVWVITTVNFSPVKSMKTWNTPTGKVDVTYKVHSVAITGYDQKYVYVNDPYGYKNRRTDRIKFEKSWKQMGRQAIVIAD
ncbi:C39 family peptidase [Bacillus sp. CLL-7-23]|uniref:C39 family peptidase n=1 Tax=Bacillus changyiensis TaxID=3004103 RepID=A0ABT4WZT2_9BACI|nr:C39 family peptidase [Bacillus changyiensis]MDA7025560.1 C39 family peptidase [Bacillus changyiensis]